MPPEHPWYPKIDEGSITTGHKSHVLFYDREDNRWYAYKRNDMVAMVSVDFNDIIRQINEREGYQEKPKVNIDREMPKIKYDVLKGQVE